MKTLTEQLAGRIVVTPSGCWEWTASRSKGGYGQVRIAGKLLYTHRVVYELLVGPIPSGMQLDHLCRNRACCNPLHADPVTMRENILRGESVPAKRARQTHCKNGHALAGDNVRVSGKGHRRCVTCYREWDRKRTPRRKRAAA